MSKSNVDVINPSTAAMVSIPDLDTESLGIGTPMKAWGCFNASPATALFGNNFMGVTNIGTGQVTITLSIVLPSNQYILAGMGGYSLNTGQDVGVYNNNASLNTTTSFTLNTVLGSSAVNIDHSYFVVIM